MNAFVINLDSRPDRLLSFQKNKFPFPVKRFPAIVSETGEDGCTLSHLAVLDSIKEFPTVVFEDDCVLINDWSVVNQAMEQLPIFWDALWLGANVRTPMYRYSKNLYRLSPSYCLHAVVYNSRKMIDYILENHNTPKAKNLDIFIKEKVISKFDCFITYPMVATQLSDISDIAKVKTNNYNEILTNYNRNAR